MVYLSLWLCSRFALAIPYLEHLAVAATTSSKSHWVDSESKRQSAPQLWQVAVAVTPIVVALYICSSRYADFHHAGFDIIAGATIGTIIGWASFRLYHLPIRRGRGYATWGPRYFGPPKEDRDRMDVATPTQVLQQRNASSYELRDVEPGGSENLAPGSFRRAPTASSNEPILPYHGQN